MNKTCPISSRVLSVDIARTLGAHLLYHESILRPNPQPGSRFRFVLCLLCPALCLVFGVCFLLTSALVLRLLTSNLRPFYFLNSTSYFLVVHASSRFIQTISRRSRKSFVTDRRLQWYLFGCAGSSF